MLDVDYDSPYSTTTQYSKVYFFPRKSKSAYEKKLYSVLSRIQLYIIA